MPARAWFRPDLAASLPLRCRSFFFWYENDLPGTSLWHRKSARHPARNLEEPQRKHVVREVVHHLAVGEEAVQMLEDDGAIKVKDALWRDWISP